MPGSCSRISGNYYLSYHPNKPTNPSDVNPNGPVITEFKTLRHLVGSAAESDTRGLFINGQNIVQILIALIELDQT